MAKKKRRGKVPVPEVLWRLFHKRARTLADTIISLIPSPPPPSPAECRCKGRTCLRCCGEAFSFLVRPDDTPDYRRLLKRCYVVVSDAAPPFSSHDHQSRWSQLEIVRRTIEIVMSEQSSSSNMVCAGYDERRRTSSAVDLLTSSEWKLLLKRVGDVLMVYLLKNTSMFLPLSRKQHHQVAGYPISALITSSKLASGTADWNSAHHLGSGMKRKRDGEVNLVSVKQLTLSSLESKISSSGTCAGCNSMSYLRQPNGQQRNAFPQIRSEKYNVAAGGTGASKKIYPLESSLDGPNNIASVPKKRVRQWRWQRLRKRRQLNLQGSFSLIPCTEGLLGKHHSTQELQCGSTSSSYFHEKTSVCCSCCLAFQTVRKVSEEAVINRRSIFYKLQDGSSLFLRNHILYTLCPNSSDANILFREIFGCFGSNISTQSLPCSHRAICGCKKSVCLYHFLIRRMKLLIRYALRCQFLRLLDKHCPVPFLDQKADDDACSMFKDGGTEGALPRNKCYRVQLEGELRQEDVHGSDVNCGNNRTEIQDCQFEPSKSFCSHEQVSSFLWSVCRSIVPRGLLGTSNWRRLRKNISMFVRLRRFESFSVKQCLHRVKTSNFPLFSNRHSTCYLGSGTLEFSEECRENMRKEHSKLDATEFVKKKILKCWVYWLFSSLVVPLIQASFYVTESQLGKQELFYYRKPVWEKLINKTVSSSKNWSYCQLNDASVRKILGNRSFGFSKVRLCSKKNGVRVLANLKSTSRIRVKRSSLTFQSSRLKKSVCRLRNLKYKYFKSVNSVLRDAQLVLKCIKMKEPEKLGSSVFDYRDIYKRLIPFISHLKSRSTSILEVFVVVSDVSRAFDSVDQDKLLSVLNDVIGDDEYALKKSLNVGSTKNSLWIHEHLSPADQDGMPKSRKGPHTVSTYSNSVLVKQGCRKVKKDQIIGDLYEHIKRNLVLLNKRFFLQSVGIPQGGVASPLLCSIYYGHLENNVLYPYLENLAETHVVEISSQQYSCGGLTGGTESKGNISSWKPKYLLLRLVDDYLFISTSKEQASGFLSRLRRGFREYNCYMNNDKFGLNFDTSSTPASPSGRISIGEDGISFIRWSGLLINCRTLELQADYSRYLDSHLRSTLTVSWRGKVGCILKEKLRCYLRPKCHAILYDSNINTPAVVRLNIYQAFVLCAMKFHCYFSAWSTIYKPNTKSLMPILRSSFRYMHGVIKRRMCSVKRVSGLQPLFEVEKWETEWLGLVANTRVLARKQSRYRVLLSLLRRKLSTQSREKNISQALEYAIDDIHSSLVWKIKY